MKENCVLGAGSHHETTDNCQAILQSTIELASMSCNFPPTGPAVRHVFLISFPERSTTASKLLDSYVAKVRESIPDITSSRTPIILLRSATASSPSPSSSTGPSQRADMFFSTC